MSKCGTQFVAMYQINDKGTDYVITPLKCKRWDCDSCRPKKALFYKSIISECFGNEQIYMYTFTYYHNKSEARTWETYNESWNRFRTAVTKKYGAMKYLRVLETHKESAYPHLHLLTTSYIAPVWFGKEVVQAGFGWSADWKRLDNTGACQYVAKYLTKKWTREDSANLRKQFHLRIVTMSQGLVDKPSHKNRWYVLSRFTTWIKARDNIEKYLNWNNSGEQLLIDNGGSATWNLFHVADWPDWYIPKPYIVPSDAAASIHTSIEYINNSLTF